MDDELKYGLAISGVVHPERVIRNVGVQKGDALILTKPLGTGIITTALKKRSVPNKSIRAAVSSMVTLNRDASRIMLKFPVHACSDVTGYGLLGHALEMAGVGKITLVLESGALPIFPGATQLADQGFLTGGCNRNRDFLRRKVSIDSAVAAGIAEVALDPQTSGGLLIAVPAQTAKPLVKELQANGVRDAAVIGYGAGFQKVRVRLAG
jgi:selenide,water dikinase